MTLAVSPVDLARAAAAAARGVPGVVDLDSGGVGEFATYGGGTRVPGVRLSPGEAVRLRLVAAMDRPLPQLAADVRSAVTAALTGSGFEAAKIDVRIVGVRESEAGPKPAVGSGQELP